MITTKERELGTRFTYINIVATLIYTPFLFQNLGDENFGLINLAFSIVIILTILVSYGYNLNGPIKIAQSKNINEEKGLANK